MFSGYSFFETTVLHLPCPITSDRHLVGDMIAI